MKDAEHGRVRDLINQIESHPHRDDLQAATTWVTWNTSDYAKLTHEYNALIVFLIVQT